MAHNIKKWRPVAREPVTKSGTKVSSLSHGIEFRNTGEVMAIINGFWKLKPDEPKFFGLEVSLDVILEEEFYIEFDKSEAGIKRVEIAEIIVKNFNYDCI